MTSGSTMDWRSLSGLLRTGTGKKCTPTGGTFQGMATHGRQADSANRGPSLAVQVYCRCGSRQRTPYGIAARKKQHFHSCVARGNSYALSAGHGRGEAIPRILIVDDHDVVRHGVRRILETQDEWEVVGEASNGQEAIRLNQQLKPDAVVMDITMPVMNGFEATKEIMKSDPNSKVLILTMHGDAALSPSVQNSGAKGLINKSRVTDELTPALKAIIAGSTYFR